MYTDHMSRRKSTPTERTNPALRAITYGRVSTGRQAESGISLDDQADSLADVVAQRGWVHVAHLTDPGLSGRKMTNRRGLQEALALLDSKGADVLVAAKIDRVSRSTTDFARLLDQAEKKGWKLVVLDADVDTTTAAGRLLVDVVSAAASFESRRIGERQKAVHAVRRSQGKRAGQAPILSDEIRLRIAQEHADGVSINGIARRLNEEAVPTAKGGRWHPSTVSHVLKSIRTERALASSRAAAES
jgi:DNA invertase Pin-like site-specific DNA recombinase